ncbi:MAG: DNA-3-methyladenine glycosylase [Ilumatobacteraceae bacterium]|nr:DNA-3-methyladenine glycosylase [Ilumatobacteraceae bacterium]
MRPVSRRLLAGDSPDVAPLLLNKLLVHGPCVGRIVEVEAYREDDPASHTFRGRTKRNEVMFGPAGHLYVYFTYGMHFCANVVTGPAGTGAAVLLRAADPVAGVDVMSERRGGRPQLADGPAKLCQAFGIDGAHNGVDLRSGGGVGLFDDGVQPPTDPRVGPRVGISKAVDVPWRWRTPLPD